MWDSVYKTVELFLLCFIPIFVAVDAVGILPLFLSLTDGLSRDQRQHLVTQATVAALAVSIIFMVAGKAVFAFLGITENDFRIAGGLVLLIISISDLAFSTLQRRRQPSDQVGVVPIGIPLIMGPAALTTLLISMDTYGFKLTLIATLANLLIVWLVFRRADWFVKLMGESGSRAVGKIMALFLAAIAVRMIRVGIGAILN